MNIILIMTDQLRYDALGCNGNRVARTPQLDSLAQKGVSFDNHFTPCPICAPSRATVFSGRYPRHHKLIKNGVAMDSSVELLTHVLAGQGWRTHGIGKFHFQPILAPASYDMPESEAFWRLPHSDNWTGPFYGFQDVEFVIGESFTSVRSGHYARWLARHYPRAMELYNPENALEGPPDDMDEVWQSAVPPEAHYNTWIADQAVDFIENYDGEDPFFLYVSFPDPHHPFSPPRPYCQHFDPDEMPPPDVTPGELDLMPAYIKDEQWLPQNDGTRISYREFLNTHDICIEQGTWQRTDTMSAQSLRKVMAYTHAMVEMIDAGVGRILKTLEKNGMTEETLIIFSSDHGELLGDHGLLRKGPMAYKQLTNIPLVMSGPGLAEGTRYNALTSHLDLKSTVLEYAGLEAGPADGSSLMPMLTGEKENVRDFLLGEYHPRTVPEQYNLSYVDEEWRLTTYPLAEERGWGELFDRKKDPNEHQNLFHDPAYAAQVKALRHNLAQAIQPAPDVETHTLCCF